MKQFLNIYISKYLIISIKILSFIRNCYFLLIPFDPISKFLSLVRKIEDRWYRITYNILIIFMLVTLKTRTCSH